MDGLLAPALSGFLLGAGLIVAIGAQNAFVLRQGLLRRHVGPVVLVCAGSDALLIACGVGGLGALVATSPGLLRIVGWVGAAFLAGYGLLALRRALHPGALRVGEQAPAPLGRVLAACLAFTFLNPHVYLDTVLLVGSLGARWTGPARFAYGAGAAMASLAWFSALGYGARLLAPLFTRPLAWRVLDAGVALVMLVLAVSLVRGISLGGSLG